MIKYKHIVIEGIQIKNQKQQFMWTKSQQSKNA